MAVNLEAERARLAQVAAPQIKKKEKARYMDGLRAQILGEPQTQPPLCLCVCVCMCVCVCVCVCASHTHQSVDTLTHTTEGAVKVAETNSVKPVATAQVVGTSTMAVCPCVPPRSMSDSRVWLWSVESKT